MKRRFAGFLAMILILGCLSGCSHLLSSDPGLDIDLSTPFVGFRTEITEQTNIQDYQRVSLETLNAYQADYGGYGVSVYFDTLTPQEQTLYRIFQYALDNGQRCIFLDDRVLGGMNQSVDQVLCSLALDNPMLEQNLQWTSWAASYTITNPGVFQTGSVRQLSGIILEIDAFSQNKLDKKLQALKVAQQVVEQMPQTLSDVEKAEYFYRYLGTHTEYFATQGEIEGQEYLYDALCVGKTNCDGFANAYSLLCYLAQIPCMEKMYSPPQSGEIGHTWNAICIDGAWYNVDATGSDEVQGDYETMHGFGCSDSLLEYVADYADRIPACRDSLTPPDCTVNKTGQAAKQVKEAYNKVKKTDRRYVIVLFPEGAVSSTVLQEIADGIKKNINTRHYITHTGAAVYYIFPQ